MIRPLCVGVDGGTTATKAAAYDPAGKLIVAGDSFGGYPILGDGIGSSEQLIEQIIPAVYGALRDLTNRLFRGGYTRQDLLAGAMAATFQMHTSVPLDEQYRPVRDRVILWNNANGGDLVAMMIEQLGLEAVIRLTNNHPTPGYSLFHNLLVKRSDPDLWSKARHIGLLNSLFAFWLTGRHALNWNDAAGTLAFDVAHGCWSKEVADWSGISAEFWPEVVAPDACIGKIRGIEAETGIPDGMRLYGGLGDCAAGALGSGVVLPGQACGILGTAGIFVVPTEQLVVDLKGGGRVQSYGFVEGLSHLLSTNLSAGACIEQLRRLVLGLKPDEEVAEADLNARLSLATLDAMASEVPFGKNGVMVDTRYAGERTGEPGWNPQARGRWQGLSPSTSLGEIHLALMMGVAFQQMLHYRICVGYDGVTMDDITLMGGGTKSPFYTALLTAGLKALNPKLVVRKLGAGQGGGARGMALLAGKGAGLITDLAKVAGDVERGEPITTQHPSQGLDMVQPMADQFQRWLEECYALQ